jgi:hypothetical protein
MPSGQTGQQLLQSKSRYYYTLLDKESQRIYRGILKGWESYDSHPSISVKPLVNRPDVSKIIDFVSWDNPGLFYVDFSAMSYSSSHTNIIVNSKFFYDKKQIPLMAAKLEQVCLSIRKQCLKPSMDKYERELSLHDWLAKNVEYAKDQSEPIRASISGCLLKHKAVCAGYSKTFKLLCDQSKISCIYVTGTATPHNQPSESHAWNIVKLNNECAHVDVTWDSTISKKGLSCYDHFNITDRDISRDHVWDRKLYPECTSEANNYFVKNGLYVRNRNELKTAIERQLRTGDKRITVRFSGKLPSEEGAAERIKKALQTIPGLSFRGMTLQYNKAQGVVTFWLI